jgi:hypothetical protein
MPGSGRAAPIPSCYLTCLPAGSFLGLGSLCGFADVVAGGGPLVLRALRAAGSGALKEVVYLLKRGGWFGAPLLSGIPMSSVAFDATDLDRGATSLSWPLSRVEPDTNLGWAYLSPMPATLVA